MAFPKSVGGVGRCFSGKLSFRLADFRGLSRGLDVWSAVGRQPICCCRIFYCLVAMASIRVWNNTRIR